MVTFLSLIPSIFLSWKRACRLGMCQAHFRKFLTTGKAYFFPIGIAELRKQNWLGVQMKSISSYSGKPDEYILSPAF
jgi:hypothetical protein